MSQIIKMSPHLANMIAAGEVVERPSSVIKELVENSIDAGAKKIDIYLQNGGIDLMKVIDDGSGMDKDDVLMSFMPHATSKIKNEFDLSRINTLGFRGEAIASIASVSKMTITSSTNGIEGFFATYEAGSLKASGVINSNKGTTVEVKNLFYNTPARLKYLKSEKTELSSIMFYINRLALAHIDIRFNVISDNKKIFSTSGSNNYQNLIGEVYGLDAAKNVITRDFVRDGYNAKLVVIKPQIYRSNKLEISLMINGRYVKNYNVTNAICAGFSTYLPINKYPICIVYIDLDPTLVDVNIHPRKTEVKLSNEEEISHSLTKEINECLKEATHIPTRTLNKEQAYVKPSILESIPKYVEEPVFVYNSKKEEEAITKIVNDSFELKEEKEEIINEPKIEEPIVNKKIPYMEYVGAVFGTYLIFQNSDGMYLMDQHAAAERINHEKFYKELSKPYQPKTMLLVPIVITFSLSEAIYVAENINQFEQIGFSLDRIGETDFALREVPLWAKFDELENIIYDIIALMIENRKIDIMSFRDPICKMISCKASIKANHRINLNEVNALIDGLNKCDNPYTCPHGRPTIIKFSKDDLEKKFERIQKWRRL